MKNEKRKIVIEGIAIPVSGFEWNYLEFIRIDRYEGIDIDTNKIDIERLFNHETACLSRAPSHFCKRCKFYDGKRCNPPKYKVKLLLEYERI